MNDGSSRDETRLWKLEAHALGAGALGGVLGGIGMGILFQLGTDIMPVLGTFLGEPSALRGWIVHLAISAFLGAAFAVVLGYPPIRDYTASFDTMEYVLSGITYVYAIAAVTVGVLPFVLELPGATEVIDPLIPREPDQSLTALLPAMVFAVAHLVYGAILGAVYAVVGVTR